MEVVVRVGEGTGHPLHTRDALRTWLRSEMHSLIEVVNCERALAPQAHAFRFEEQVLNRGGTPARLASQRAFPHGFELYRDLLHRALGRRRLNAGNHQAIVALLRPGALQQACLDNALVAQPAHRATKPLDGPGGGSAAVQDLHDVAPGLVGTHPQHRWQPVVQPDEDTPGGWHPGRREAYE